jgi:hypothetical protein
MLKPYMFHIACTRLAEGIDKEGMKLTTTT